MSLINFYYVNASSFPILIYINDWAYMSQDGQLSLLTNQNNCSQDTPLINIFSILTILILKEKKKNQLIQIYMNQKIAKKEQNFKKLQLVSGLVTCLLKNRACLLINNPNHEVHKQIKLQQMWASDQKIIDNFKDEANKYYPFRQQSLIVETRSWEGLTLNRNNTMGFHIGSSRLLVQVNHDFFTNHQTMSEQVILVRVFLSQQLVAAKIKILKISSNMKSKLVDQQLLKKDSAPTKFYGLSFTKMQNIWNCVQHTEIIQYNKNTQTTCKDFPYIIIQIKFYSIMQKKNCIYQIPRQGIEKIILILHIFFQLLKSQKLESIPPDKSDVFCIYNRKLDADYCIYQQFREIITKELAEA
ncbi:hypothetical protein pb186bvf_020340 [Paramecium bursaria]